jgi:tetratricopeptide (TPR) repeat protein
MMRIRLACVAVGLAGAALWMTGCGARSLVAVRETGDQHFQYREYNEAIADYKEYIDRNPGNAHVHQMLGNAYIKVGQTGLGCEQLKLAHALRLEDDEIFADLCKGLYADKKYDDLNRALRERTIGRGRMQDWALLAAYAEKLGDQDEAQRAWLTAAQVDGGKSAVPQLGLAKLYMKVGDKDRARKRLAMAYYCDPTNAEITNLAKELNEIPGPTYGVVPEEQGASIQIDPSRFTPIGAPSNCQGLSTSLGADEPKRK